MPLEVEVKRWSSDLSCTYTLIYPPCPEIRCLYIQYVFLTLNMSSLYVRLYHPLLQHCTLTQSRPRTSQKKTQQILNWCDRPADNCDNFAKGDWNRRTQPSCLHMPTCNGVYKMRFCNSAQTAVLCTDVHECPEVFVFNKHMCFITPNSSAACHISILPYRSVVAWCYRATYDEIPWDQGRIFFTVVVDSENRCWRTSTIKCTLSVQDTTSQTWTLKLNII